ncbi:MAG: AMP-binding protein, partial [Acidimicrobiales bacterium]
GTATAGPNFTWVLATRALRRAEGLDLSRLRIALNGAEPVDPASDEAFVEAGARHGMRPGAVFPAFGMAEVAIAGTFPVPLTGLQVDSVDLRVLETEGYAAPIAADAEGQRSFVVLGRPVPGLEIRVVDREDGRPLVDREAGELEIRGTSVTTGYYRNEEATRALRRAEVLDLSRLRIALNGAEPVDPASVEAFVEAGARHGMRPGAVFPAFGMAEVAIAGTFPVPMTGLQVDSVDLRVLETEGYAAPIAHDAEGQRSFVVLGRPVPGLEIRVVDREDGHPLADREAGELEIQGTSVTAGYYRNEEATRALFHDGWLRTGDLAYLIDGQLVICGRLKDVIIIGGRNVFPEDIERGVAEVEGVRPGNVIAFGVEGAKGRETLVVVAEVRSDDHDTVRKEVHHRVMEVSGVPPHEVLLVAPGSLPKTSSGKLQRSTCRERYHADELQPA